MRAKAFMGERQASAEGEPKYEAQVNQAKGMRLHREDSAIERPGDKSYVETADDYG